MAKLILPLFLLSLSVGFSQEKKLIKLLGKDFHAVSGRTSLPYMERDPKAKFVASISLKDDTTGLVYQNEFILFRNNDVLSTEAMKGSISFAGNHFVSNAEYQEFQAWVRDSMALERLYANMEDDEEAAEFLKIPSKKMTDFDFSDREQNRYDYTLNWKKAFSYNDPKLMPGLADMYITQYERFYRNRAFDERKNVYSYFIFPYTIGDSVNRQITSYTSTISHEAFWAAKSASTNDELSVLGQTYDQLAPNAPLIGITGMQANAFCHWKQINLQQKADKARLPYQVRVTLPLVSETDNEEQAFNVPTKDYTPIWQITVQDYQEFTQAVHDSILMEALFNELKDDQLANEFIQIKTPFFSEEYLEFKKMNPAERAKNRRSFNLTKDKKILQKYASQFDDLEKRYADQLDDYTYFRMNITAKGIVGESRTEPWLIDKDQYVEAFYPSEIDSLGEPIGMDLNIDYVNRLLQGTGVRSHENLKRFILKETVSIMPSIAPESQNKEALVKGITYEQALAYYHWKFPIWKAKTGDNWQDFVYPSEEQFTKIQNGETIVIPEHKLDFPSPTFRYVVTFIPTK